MSFNILTYYTMIPPYIQELLAAYEKEASDNRRPRLLITAAVAAGKGHIDSGYEIAEVSKWVSCDRK